MHTTQIHHKWAFGCCWAFGCYLACAVFLEVLIAVVGGVHAAQYVRTLLSVRALFDVCAGCKTNSLVGVCALQDVRLLLGVGPYFANDYFDCSWRLFNIRAFVRIGAAFNWEV